MLTIYEIEKIFKDFGLSTEEEREHFTKMNEFMSESDTDVELEQVLIRYAATTAQVEEESEIAELA